MKKLILLTCSFLLCIASACGKTDKTKITIQAQNYPLDSITLAWRGDGEPITQTIALTDGRGSAEVDLPEGSKISLVNLDGSKGIEMPDGAIPAPTFDFYVEKGNVEITFDNNEWPAVAIKGVRLNNDLNKYWTLMGPLEKRSFECTRKMIAEMLAGEEIGPDPEAVEVNRAQEEVMNDYISQNPDSELSLELLLRMYIERNGEFESRYLALSERVRNPPEGVTISEQIEKAKTLAEGNRAPLFSKTDKDGNKISLADLRGKWVLLDFWGTWCGPCRMSHPHLVEQYNKYSPEGVVFINIAMEDSQNPQWRETWLKAIEDDGLAWTNIADNEFPAEGSIVDSYQISAFPTKVLIDPDGMLAGFFIGGDIDTKLEETFGK